MWLSGLLPYRTWNMREPKGASQGFPLRIVRIFASAGSRIKKSRFPCEWEAAFWGAYFKI